MTTPPPIWTPAQWRAITTTGRSLLVSAAAGSGKTAVLAERCAYLVCDAAPPCDVEQLLVVTFTEAAAAQMKGRIEQALRQRVAASPGDSRLVRELALIDRAHVGTLHGFCARLLRRHYHEAGLTADFEILDEDHARLLAVDAVKELFLDRYDQDADGSFGQFIADYGDGRDEPLMDEVRSAHALLRSLVDAPQWLAQAQSRLEEAAGRPLDSSDVGRGLIKLMHEMLDALVGRCNQAAASVPGSGPMAPYAGYMRKLAASMEEWRERFGDGDFDALTDAGPADIGKKPPIKKDVPGKESADAMLESVRKDKDKAQKRALFNTAQWQEALRVTLQPAAIFLELVAQFGQRFTEAKRRQGGLDFADLENLTLKVLRDPAAPGLAPSEAARACQQRFQHVLVDEYQDINEVQDAILQLVSREGAGDLSPGGNLFCVGDVKQSIYRFRLAEPRRFLERYERFRATRAGDIRGGVAIDLQTNFRSRAPLLAGVNALFSRLMTASAVEIEYDKSQQLEPGLQYPPPTGPGCFTGAPVEFLLLPKGGAPRATDEEEADDGEAEDDLDRAQCEAVVIAQQIGRLLGRDGSEPRLVAEKDAQGKLAYRPIRCRDIVVLLRSQKHKAKQYADILRQSDIPAHRETGTGLFESLEISDMLALLALLDNLRQDIPLAAVLRSPLAGLPEAEAALARIHVAFADTQPPMAFHQAVVEYSRVQTDELAERLRTLLERIEGWRRLARQRPVAELIWTIYDQTNYLAYCSGLAGGEQRCANLLYLYDRAKQFGGVWRQGLAGFLAYLQSLQDQSDLGQPSVLSEAEDVVRIMSIHRAKGLEFPVVFVADLGKKINMDDASGSILVDRREFLGLQAVDERRRIRYPSPAWLLVRDRLRRQALAEELRVLYVAMTRAQEQLFLIGTCGAKQRETWQSLWGADRGPLPSHAILAANSMLDWVGPAAVAAEGESPGQFQITMHDQSEILTIQARRMGRQAQSERQKSLADWAPLVPPPPLDQQARAIIDRLTFSYPFDALTRVAASQPATQWAGHGSTALAGAGGPGSGDILDLPRFAAGDSALGAADRGTATHLVLQHLDYSRPCTADDLEKQIQNLVKRQFITPVQAAAVDRAAIQWMMESDLGQLLRRKARNLQREVAFNLAMPPSDGPTAAPMDQVMVRGRIDLLVLDGGQYTVIDYKTDQVTGPALDQRAESYAPQLRLYSQAVTQITGCAVKGAYLVFLAARVIREAMAH